MIADYTKNRLKSEQISGYFCANCFVFFDFDSDNNKNDKNFSQAIFNKTINSSYLSLLSPPTHIEVQAYSKYRGIIKDSIHLLKYNGKTQLATPFGFLLFQTFVQFYGDKAIDFIVPIPLYYLKMVKRGFNQSFLLIKNFQNYWLELKGNSPSWQIAPEILIRKRDTKSQTGFNREQRRNNVRGAFALRKKDILKNRIKGKNILLVDDVYTTGATTNEAGFVLLEAGALSVKLLVLAQV